VVKQGSTVVIHLGSEIVLHSEQWVLLRFRLVAGSDQEPGTPSPQKGRGNCEERGEQPEEALAGLDATMAFDFPLAEAGEEDDEEEAVAETALEAWRFVCTYAEGMPQSKLEALPHDLRGINLKASGPGGVALLGREHQHRHFEVWLPDSSVRLNVSRTHLQISACGSGVTARNVGSNPMCVGRDALVLGQAQFLDEGKVLRFTRFTGGNRVCFLMLELMRTDDPASGCGLGNSSPKFSAQPTRQSGSVAVKPGTQKLQRSMSSHAALQVVRRDSTEGTPGGAKSRVGGQSYSPKRLCAAAKRQQQERQEKQQQQPQQSSSTQQQAPAAARCTTAPSLAHAVPARQCPTDAAEQPKSSQLAGSVTPPHWRQSEECSQEVFLEVHSEQAKDVPVEQRRLGPFSLTAGQPIAFGKRHQPQFYKEVLREDGLAMMEDDLFCIAYEDEEFCVVALTTVGIWHSKEGHAPSHIEQDGLALLEAGDRITINVGQATDSDDKAVEHTLSWHFRRADARSPRLAGSSPRRSVAARTEGNTGSAWWSSPRAEETSSPEARPSRKIRCP